MLAHVQHKDLDVPLPVGSYLLIGNSSWAFSSLKETQSSVMFINSISRSIHQEAITATLPEKAGPPGERGAVMPASS